MLGLNFAAIPQLYSQDCTLTPRSGKGLAGSWSITTATGHICRQLDAVLPNFYPTGFPMSVGGPLGTLSVKKLTEAITTWEPHHAFIALSGLMALCLPPPCWMSIPKENENCLKCSTMANFFPQDY